MYPKLIFEGQEYSKEWFQQESGRVAAGLRTLGLVEGDCVALMMRNCPEYVAAVIACRRAGCYVVAVNWHFKANEVNHILTDSGTKAFFVHDDLLGQAAGGVPNRLPVVVVERHDLGSAADPKNSALPSGATSYVAFGQGLPEFNEQILVTRGAIPYTSGTSGKPKGVRRRPLSLEASREADARLARLQIKVFGLGPDTVALLSAPIYHSAPMSYLVCSCLVGATLVLEAGFDAKRTLELIEKHSVTHLYLVPTMMQRLLRLDEDSRSRRPASVVRAISTGSACATEVKRAMINWWGPVIYEAYASSETGYLTLIDSEEALERPRSVGRAVGDATVRILLEDGTQASTGQVGLIYARQPDYPDFTYINNEEARAAVGNADLICVGDMGYLDAEGYLFISDRKSDMVISGGVNIYPAEIEAELLLLPGVADCAVFGIPDEEYGESLAAVIQPAPGAELGEMRVRAHLQARLANFKVPRVIEFKAELPREDSGKIFKRLLREPYWKGRGRAI